MKNEGGNQITSGLIIKPPYVDWILDGRKTWELRSTGTNRRGLIALIGKGTGKVLGIASLVDSHGPLSADEMDAATTKHLVTPERLASGAVAKYRYAWELVKARRLREPVSYTHPSGAVIWVNLEPRTIQEIERQL